MAYFQRTGPTTFLPLPATSGAWNVEELHIAPVLGLMTHVLEESQPEGKEGFFFSRLSFDILGTIRMESIEITVELLRPGRSVELWEVTAKSQGRVAVRMRAWNLAKADTAQIAGTPVEMLAPRASMEAFRPADFWPGQFIETVEIHRRMKAPGESDYWARLRLPLIEGERVRPLTHTMMIVDIANGMSVRESPHKVAFPNLDLTVSFWDTPSDDWVGFRTEVTFGTQGIGLTHTHLYKESGPVGVMTQSLTVRTQG